MPTQKKKTPRRATNPQFDSLLTSLPLELRQEIYSYLFSNTIVVLPRRMRGNPKGLSRSPPFLLTCKGFYSEAIDFYYKHSIFQMKHARANSQLPCLPKWLKKIGKKRAGLIREFRVVPPEIAEEVAKPPVDPFTLMTARCENAEWTIERAKYWVGKDSGVEQLANGVFKSCVCVHIELCSEKATAQDQVWTTEPMEYLKKWKHDHVDPPCDHIVAKAECVSRSGDSVFSYGEHGYLAF
ncbi:hypothetical protein CB0940_01918 [Cercospora beticola]|uniref:F-box domain-containing protein n=1 Tax=Cercospora beticola TaxID=122368 RepID=A0A2G5IBS2_CERBT|nr:hypothetical protein CB0940_01918 [Cercospora beticola]PIB02190.1 hypothetical protein CB0940_01918 [Cercospora beticola]WPA97380.1 hypothetical protein RHO25_001989 [Cercospora beticola]